MFFGVLGSVGAWTDGGRAVPVPGAKVRVLLAALLAAEGRVVTADHLIDALWGDELPGDPYGTLSGKFTQLRRALDAAEPGARRLVESPPPGYRLRLGNDGLDVHRFRALTQRARATADARRRAELLCDALALWRGPAFADVADCGFTRASVARLTEERLVALEEYAEARLALGEHATVVAELAGLIAEYPLRERLRAAHILALYRSGRQSDALASYADLRTQLADDLGVEPSDELATLQSAVLSRDPALELQPAPAPRVGADRPRTNLPAIPGTLIGRADAVAAVRSRLESERLVTLVGPGGVGKTRLAVQAAAESAEAFHDGVWLVELAELAPTSTATPADVVRAVLGVRDAGTSADDGLVAALRAGTCLLVLDNCEHVVEQVAPLVDRLVRGCPGLRVLATSREPLGATGEVLVDVPPLAVPNVSSAPGPRDDGGNPAWPAQLADFPAIRLFIDRASAASPGFALEAANAHAVVEVCRRLDGLPLALELAANRVRALGVHELAKRLDDRFRLLDVGPRGAPQRQRSLGAVIDWSWELLPEPERMVLRRIAVFTGGCTLEAAEAVCDGDVLDALSRLVDRSFLEVTHSPDGPRYRLLESLAAYGRDRLAESGEAGSVRDRYVTYYSALAERADAFLRGHDQRCWLRRLDAETANLRAAVDVALRGDTDADRALRLVTALTWYWFLRGRLTEAHRALGAAVGIDGPAAPVLRDRARDLLAAVGLLLGQPGRPAPPWHADTVERARSQWFLAYAESDFGDVPAVEARLDAALASFSDSGDDWGIAAVLSTKAKLAQVRTDRTLLARDAARSDALFRAVGDRWGRLQATMWLSGLAEMRGDYDRAARLNADGLRMAEELELWPDVASRTGWAGWIAMQQRDYSRAVELCVEARRLAYEQGYQIGTTLALLGLAFAARRLGDHDEAETQLRGLLEAAGDRDGDQPPPLHLPLVLSELGFLLYHDDRFDEAADLHRKAFAAARILDNARSMATALEGLAGTLTVGGHHQTAAVLLGSADAVRQAASTPRSPGDQDDVDRITDAIRAALSGDEFDAAHRRGSRLTPEEARALAG